MNQIRLVVDPAIVFVGVVVGLILLIVPQVQPVFLLNNVFFHFASLAVHVGFVVIAEALLTDFDIAGALVDEPPTMA